VPESANPPLLVFADDWGRHPSSCQHLIRALLPRQQVYWINTIGMRRPGFNLSTVTRGAGKLRSWLSTVAGVSQTSNPRVVNPRMWPTFRGTGRRINQILLDRQLRPLFGAMAEPPVAITTLPITADLMGALPVSHWVYYCVDDFSRWPGLDQHTLGIMEQQVVERCDRLVAVSETLCERLQQMGREASLLTHGVDLEHFRTSLPARTSPELAGIEKPIIAFWGLVDRRLDVECVHALAASLLEGTVVLIGPQLDPDPALWSSPRVRHIPPVSYRELPRLACWADVLIMPYADLPVTRAIQPLKLKEYLATGKPVVVSNLPAVAEWSDCLDIVKTPADFVAAVMRRLAEGVPASQREARERLDRESWEAKAAEFERLAIRRDAGAASHSRRCAAV
jgi:glycosyltransferase involved in cell wall biosynthesis